MKKIGLICLALVLALGTLGVGYAMWDKTLYIDGTVNTGSVDVALDAQLSNDPSPGGPPYLGGPVGLNDPSSTHAQWDENNILIYGDASAYWTWTSLTDPTTWVWNGPRYDKNVAWTTCVISGDTLTVTVYNGYPGYAPDVMFTVKNTGTVPVKCSAKLVSVTTGAGTWNPDLTIDLRHWYTADETNQDIDINQPPDGDDAFTMVLSSQGATPLYNIQVEPDELAMLDVGVCIEQQAAESQTNLYQFKMQFSFYNWNE